METKSKRYNEVLTGKFREFSAVSDFVRILTRSSGMRAGTGLSSGMRAGAGLSSGK